MKINLPSSDKMPIVYARMNYDLSHSNQSRHRVRPIQGDEVLIFCHGLTILRKPTQLEANE